MSPHNWCTAQPRETLVLFLSSAAAASPLPPPSAFTETMSQKKGKEVALKFTQKKIELLHRPFYRSSWGRWSDHEQRQLIILTTVPKTNKGAPSSHPHMQRSKSEIWGTPPYPSIFLWHSAPSTHVYCQCLSDRTFHSPKLSTLASFVYFNILLCQD